MANTNSTTDYRLLIQQLVEQARQLTEPEQVMMLEEAVAVADAHHDNELGYEIRLELMNAALSCGKADSLLVAFTWCAAMADREPERYDTQRVLWWNRWAVIYAPTFPSIRAERIHAALADMEQRYRKAGASLRTVYWARWKVAFEMGDRPTATRAFRAMKRTRTDWLGPDPDTEEVMHVEYWNAFNQHARVAKAAATMRSRHTGGYYEQQILSWQMAALMFLNRFEEAMACHHACYRKMLRHPSVVIQASRHLAFLAVTCNFPRAFRLLERYLGYCVGSDPQDQFEMYNAADLLFRSAARFGQDNVRLRLPAQAPGYQPQGQYPSLALADAFRLACLAHAQRFDERNGNEHYRRTHDRLQKLLRRARPVPLTT